MRPGRDERRECDQQIYRTHVRFDLYFESSNGNDRGAMARRAGRETGLILGLSRLRVCKLDAEAGWRGAVMGWSVS